MFPRCRWLHLVFGCLIHLDIILATTTGTEEMKPAPVTLGYKANSVIVKHNKFAFRFYNTTRPKTNSFFAPFSIVSSLIMLYLGTDGETAQELNNALGFHFEQSTPETFIQTFVPIIRPLKDRDRKNVLTSSTAVLVHTTATIMWSYEQIVKFLFGVTIARQDFLEDSEDVLQAINNWAQKATKDKMKSILDSSMDLDTHMLLMNAIYFNGTWQQEFDRNKTIRDKFYNNGVLPKTASMMVQQNTKCRYAKIPEHNLQILELPYVGNYLSMIILLPTERNGLTSLHQNLTYDKVQNFISKLQNVSDLRVVLPKFKLGYSTNVIPHLQQLGITTLFTTDADLSKMSNDTSLLVADYKHKATIVVDEKGTEASASSAIEVDFLSAKDEFVANHPFMFLVQDTKDGLILFLGRLEEL